MGFFDDILNPKPKFVSDISTKIRAYFIDENPDFVRLFQSDAIYYAENKNNWAKIEEGLNSGKDAEYFALIFISLSVRAILLKGEFHIYAGMMTAEGEAAYAMYCDCLDRLVKTKGSDKADAKTTKERLRQQLVDIG
jgi:hypothetical protein